MESEWETIPLEELVERERGISYGIVQPGAAVTDGVPIVRVTDVRNGRISTADPLRVAPHIEADYARTRLRGGELLLTLVGTVGETAVVPKSLRGWNVARAVAVIPVRPEIGAYWVQVALRTPIIRHIIDSRLNTTVQATLNLRDVARLPIVVPPKTERERIAHILGRLDDKIELNRRMNQTLEAMARSIFKSWFVDFDPVRAKSEGRDASLPKHIADLFPDHLVDSELGEIPEGWTVQPFSETVEVIGGGTPKTSVSEYWDGDIPWFSVVDAPSFAEIWVVDTEKKVTQKGVEASSTKLLPVGTTIISARGTVGRLALVGVPMAMNQSCYGLRGKQGTKGFFNYFSIRTRVNGLQQRAHGSVFDTITRDTLAGVAAVVPPDYLVDQFERFAEPLLNGSRQNLLQSRTLAALRDALLPKLISGDLRVNTTERLISEVV
jgi:type I restriction enzyme S subunit